MASDDDAYTQPAPSGVDDITHPEHYQDTGDQDQQPHGIKGLKHKVTDKKDEIKDKASPPGGYDDTPYADLPPGYTIRVVFHKAENLPAADITTRSADPWVHATLTAALPKRHKEDPVPTKRTRTVRTSTNPEWEEEWIVANVPATGFRLKCRLYDEDYPDHDDRLGNVTFESAHLQDGWTLGPQGQWFDIKKRMGSKRAYLFKAITSSVEKGVSMTGRLHLSIDVLCRSEGKGAHMYTIGPSYYFKHFSPVLGRLAGIKVNDSSSEDEKDESESHLQKYDFQANEIQLAGPVPEHLYHRFVEFKHWVGSMFTSKGIRGKVLHKVLHKQHNRIYNFNASTQWGQFKACTDEASLQFLRMAHFDEGGRVFTYVLLLDGLMRFTETGKEFGIDFLSKHTMHSDVSTYIAFSGEFFIRRLAKPDAPEHQGDPDVQEPTHPSENLPGGPPHDEPPAEPKHYQLIIDNDSGTYRPDKSVLPQLQEFLARNFPGLSVVAMHWEDEKLQKMKDEQRKIKKKEGKMVKMVLNHSPDSSSISSSDESRLGDLYSDDDEPQQFKSKKGMAYELMEDPKRLRDLSLGGGGSLKNKSSHNGNGGGEGSAPAA